MSEKKTSEAQYASPSNQCLQHIVKIAVVDDKPIMLDYWTDSQENKVLIGVRDNGEKLLVKSEEEYIHLPLKKYIRLKPNILLLLKILYIWLVLRFLLNAFLNILSKII